jgi:ADP-ribose pyrophosphatase
MHYSSTPILQYSNSPKLIENINLPNEGMFPMSEFKNNYPDLPRVAVGAIVFKGNSVLLVRRANAPSRDMWAIPGGNVKLGESLQQAAEREILEETGVRIHAGNPVFTFDHIEQDDSGRVQYHYVIVDMLADYLSGEPQPGDDAADARWVSPAAIKTLKVSAKTLKLLKTEFGFGET